jgi:hypothetical protein
MLQLIINRIKLLAGILLVLGAFSAGMKWGSTTQVIEKEVKGETVTVYKDRIVTVTKIVKPDGTVEETTKTEEKDKTKKEKETKKEPVVVAKSKSKYSVGYILRPHWPKGENDLLPGPAVSHGVSAGYNLLDPLWLKFGVIPSDKIYTLGLEVQF